MTCTCCLAKPEDGGKGECCHAAQSLQTSMHAQDVCLCHAIRIPGLHARKNTCGVLGSRQIAQHLPHARIRPAFLCRRLEVLQRCQGIAVGRLRVQAPQHLHVASISSRCFCCIESLAHSTLLCMDCNVFVGQTSTQFHHHIMYMQASPLCRE